MSESKQKKYTQVKLSWQNETENAAKLSKMV